MLISKKNILETNPPFLMALTNNQWQIVAQITLLDERYKLTIIEKIDGKFTKRILQLDETPYHVGVDVWELNYGATLMTLKHESLADHPAKGMWQEFLKSNK